MRRTALIGLAALVLAAACGGSASGGGGSIKVAFIPQIVGIPYFTAMQQGGQRAAEDLGVTFTYRGPTTTSAPQQVQLLDTFVQQRYSAVSISVLDPASLNPAIAAARAKGVHVLTSDSDSPSSQREAFVAQASDRDLGFTLVDHLAAQIGNQGRVAIVSGEPTATNLNTWIRYMQQRVAERYPRISLVAPRYTSSTEDAQSQAQDLLTRYPDLKGLIAVASTTVPGVAQAVQAAGKAGKVAVIGYGSPNTARPFIKSGVMKESILWNPVDLGYLTVWAMVQTARGKGFQTSNQVPGLKNPIAWDPTTRVLLLGPPLVIDAQNVGSFNF
jgi:ABC-type sugar transport system substrate-binding protein